MELIRSGRVEDASALADELSARSGLDRLRAVLLQQFELRSRILKARSALALLGEVLRADGCEGSAQLCAAVEELTASTHGFDEGPDDLSRSP